MSEESKDSIVTIERLEEVKRISACYDRAYDQSLVKYLKKAADAAALRMLQGDPLFSKYLTEKPSKNGKIHFITVNFYDDLKLIDAMKKATFKFIVRPIIKNYCLVFEQRSDTENFHGPHIHIVTDKVVEKTRVIKYAFSTFKRVVGSIQSIDVKEFDSSYRSDKIDYCMGLKWDDKKLAAIKMNLLFRKKYNIEEIYNAEETSPKKIEEIENHEE